MGRLIWDADAGPFHVVVDGRALSWHDLGEALSSFEGFRFRLTIEDSMADARSERVKAALGEPDTPS
ncbi:hypothetical protein M2283_009819 [Streptomyces pseudovenezuelae]|uniref:DUF7713 domain-containing protein n=1 Tax=Streptomyces pseudovenezuelae TaxID=67350 RepID=A0ABT6M1P1_9ACTN|nr:hypothetical protein [Streptomyces pseudovenezuelae]MDH6222468.1 hypothetical protein [Streptomyces pseudovenezuelae]